MTVDFYHLAASPLERVLPAVAEKVVAGGGRLLVVGEEALLARIDAQLWTYRPDSFLPHGRAGAEGDAEQPVLLSSGPAAVNGARNVAIADGIWREEALGFERAFYFFDSARLDDARGAWRALGGREGVERRFWKQDDRGRWIEGP
ncbi:DNA polymerase III subunit chi [Allosphingosinicella indica]|uniref:DNA polymerase III, chi subunit n=1 Tax=Allosphingosinicella indica TaxID=941907 RepID=A0A1X7H3I5_9SPHN|nr:DNA polymerase III subunit chi [Allosphingosinicella indica]SMF78940.1 DNA polymerase III, chi subunit [Allosphingosinicella indica]